MPNIHDVFSIGIDAREDKSFDSGGNEASNEASNEGDGGIDASVAQRGEEVTTRFGLGLLWNDYPLWQNKYCKLLNDDFSFFGRAMVQV